MEINGSPDNLSTRDLSFPVREVNRTSKFYSLPENMGSSISQKSFLENIEKYHSEELPDHLLNVVKSAEINKSPYFLGTQGVENFELIAAIFSNTNSNIDIKMADQWAEKILAEEKKEAHALESPQSREEKVRLRALEEVRNLRDRIISGQKHISENLS